MIDDLRAQICEFIPLGLERKLIRGGIACAHFAWARANNNALLQKARAEFSWSERMAITALAADSIRRVDTKLCGSISAIAINAPGQLLRDLNAGASCARRSGRVGAMPSLGEQFNDWHQHEGLRAAAVHLREATRR
ncbi:hypothetical protein [Rhodobacter sp. SY28-1]|uniref:hypothetical protein n=1 Tax=Rhodobacter sp. SY28-1 TaxID=2562317 RepID=UPI0010BF936E|nr:hypothetical protein [Rhodobacter sp. SY28-1]